MRSATKKWKASRTSGATKCMALVQQRLEEHPHFRGRSSLFTIELVHSAVVVSRRLLTVGLRRDVNMFRAAIGFFIAALLAALLEFGVGTDYAWAAGLLFAVFVVIAAFCFLGGTHAKVRLSRDQRNLARLSAWRATKKSLKNGGVQ